MMSMHIRLIKDANPSTLLCISLPLSACTIVYVVTLLMIPLPFALFYFSVSKRFTTLTSNEYATVQPEASQNAEPLRRFLVVLCCLLALPRQRQAPEMTFENAHKTSAQFKCCKYKIAAKYCVGNVARSCSRSWLNCANVAPKMCRV